MIKRLIKWLADRFGVVTERVIVEKVTEVRYIGGMVEGDVVVDGNLTINGDLKVTGCITLRKEVLYGSL